MVNKWTKYFTKWKLTGWFQEELDKVIDQREDLDEIEICYLLSVLKALHASWLVELYNLMITNDRKEVIMNGWKR